MIQVVAFWIGAAFVVSGARSIMKGRRHHGK